MEICQQIIQVLCLIVLPIASSSSIRGNILLKDKFPVIGLKDVHYGWGYSSITLKDTYNQVVEVDMMPSADANYDSGVIDSLYKIFICKTSGEYKSFISGSLSVSGTYMGVTVKPSIKVMTEVKVSTLDTILVAHVDITTDTRVATSPNFTHDAQTLLNKGHFEYFVETYGTHYLKEVILGGKMILVMKFSSSSKENKRELDAKLGVYAGGFSAEAEFSEKLRELKETYSMEMYLLAQGSDLAPPHPDVAKGIAYAVNFARNVKKISVIKEVHYTGIWSLPSAPPQLKNTIFGLQASTEELMTIATSLSESEDKLNDMIALRFSDMSYFSQNGWKECERLYREVKDDRLDLETKFRVTVTNLAELNNILARFQGTDLIIASQINSLLTSETTFLSSYQFTLKSLGAHAYISRDAGGYPTLDTASYIPLSIQTYNNTIPSHPIRYGVMHYHFLKSLQKPGHKLCMTTGDWYVYWIADKDMKDEDYCLWNISHTTDRKRKVLQYGDAILIYNRKFPDYIVGVSSNGRWLEDVAATEVSNPLHQWFVGKI